MVNKNLTNFNFWCNILIEMKNTVRHFNTVETWVAILGSPIMSCTYNQDNKNLGVRV